MSTQFLSKLSQNYIELLNDDEYYDTTIEVGKDPDVKILRGHMSILCYRSPYLRRVFASSKKNDDNILVHIKLPNISPESFQIILKYIYGGVLSLNEHDILDIIKVLTAADELLLQELIDYLQRYVIENQSKWMEQHFELIHRTSFQSNSLIELQQFCTEFMAKFPEKIFKSHDFASLSEKSLVQLVKRDDLQMKEVEVWEHVLKWGLAQNPTLLPDPNNWLDNDFKTMENTLQHCLSFIRFFSLSSKDFLQKVRPYRKLLKHQLYEDLLNSHLDPDIKPTDDISLPRNIKTDKIIDSKIINLSIVSTISRWIDKMDANNNFSHIRELYLPYEFQLLLRGSRDGFSTVKFHELCDGKYNTVTFIKVKETEEVIGGYNPLKWESSGGWCKTKGSFIFSFKNENNFIKDAIISNAENTNYAFWWGSSYGPYFGEDIVTASHDYNRVICRKRYYEKKIRDTEDQLSIEDYEVFSVMY